MQPRTRVACLYRVALVLTAIAAPAGAQVIQWTRQFGSIGADYAYGVTTAPGAIYAVGEVRNAAFPGNTNSGGADAFVSKLDPEGNLIWSRQFGTSATDVASGAAADATGVYVVGYSRGGLEGASGGGSDAFVRKYSPEGNVLWTRQFGGSGDDAATAAVVDSGGLYVAGYAVGALPGQTASGGDDAFVRKYDFNGNEQWTRQFGTPSSDKAYGIASDASGIYVLGETNGALGTAVGGNDYFIRKFSTAGNALWTQQFGTTTTDGGFSGGGIAVNSTGVYATGGTSGTFPGQTKVGGYDAFVQKFDLNGNSQWVRQFGTTSGDFGYGIALGGGLVYVAGQAGSGLFLWRFDASGADLGNLQRGTFATAAYGLATDGNAAYIAGNSSSNQLGQNPVGDQDAFVFKVPHPPQLSGVSDAFTGQVGVAPTTWISLYGAALSGTTRTWDTAISGNQLPKALDEVRVDINGRAATMYFVSPGQVNVLAPLDNTTGNIQITITNRYGTSPPLQVAKTNTLPAFYSPFADASGRQLTAVALDGTLVGKVGVDPRVTRAARPGEILLVFASGFGLTNPAAPSDIIFAGAPELVTAPRITIGNRDATFGGKGYLAAPGLYQFNITVPDLGDGEYAIVAEAGGVRSLATVFLSIRR